MTNKIFQTATLAVLASMIFYCGATYKASIPDATATDAGANDATVERVCDCPEPTPPAITVTSKMVFNFVFESHPQQVVIGQIPDFDPDGPEGMPVSVGVWYYNGIDSRWVKSAVQSWIDDAGNVTVVSGATEMVNRNTRIVFTFVKPNPDL